MPQLMPLNWCISFLMVVLFFVMMIFIYYSKLENDNDCLFQGYESVILNWKW